MSNSAIQNRDNKTQAIEVSRLNDQPAYFTPLVDVCETTDAFVFRADLPGAKASSIDVTYHDRVLTIEAKVEPRQSADHPYLRREYGVGPFYRQFSLQTPVDAAQIKAQYRNGTLEIRVPKEEAAKKRKVQIKAD